MTRACALPVVVIAVVLALTHRARAQEPAAAATSPAPSTALEVSLRAGASLGLSFRSDPISDEAADLGAAAGLSVLLRTRYFLAPELDVSYAMLFRGHGFAASGSADGAIDALSVSFGPTIDVAPWLRIRAGVALSWILVSATVDGYRASTSSLQMGYLLGVSSLFLSAGRFRAGLDLRAMLVTEASMMGLTLGVTGTFGAITWRSRRPPHRRASTPALDAGE